MKTISKYAAALFLMVGITVPAQAAENHGMLQQRVKIALNDMVQDVKAAETPSDKREILNGFLHKMEKGSKVAERLPFLSQENHAALAMLQDKFGGYSAELRGTAGQAPVADKDLDGFASFMQQNLEQAESSWGDGGIYLSTGAVIIILIIIILIT
jgi:hypothetical protein